MLTDDKIIEIFNTVKSKREFLDAVGIPYLHRSGTKIDNDILSILGSILNITKNDISANAFKNRYKQRMLKDYYDNPIKCVICGNIVPIERVNTFTCSPKCCHIKANKNRGKHSEETKRKISETLLYKNALKIDNKQQYYFKHYYQTCVICGKTFKRVQFDNGRLSCATTCSDECRLKLKQNQGRKAYEICKANGTFKGWQSRNIISYPEKFWMNVLNNNNIEYIHNYPFNKYFFDFYIEYNGRKIDLEIDGKQHLYSDRIESDNIRNEFVKSNGIEVYRIVWNEINSDKGKQLMKDKIDKFIEYLNK